MGTNSLAPKCHLLLHLLAMQHGQKGFGNACLYNTFEDEALNRLLKPVLKRTSQATFDFTTLYNMQEALDRRKRERED